MAVRDDVITGESYYIKEIKYLKRMTESVNEKRLMFFAIDEILKGTNTRERIAASKAVLKYFSDKNCILIVATHDTELANAFDNSFENYYFTENVSDGDISFDYKLHKGISKTTNAIRLLEIIGFPEEIIKTASAQ
jgi:DNA mismatch repair ATPase MutS